MPFVSLDYPPGVFRNGTRLQARNRWFDSNLVRWFAGAMGPVGGWQTVPFTSPDITPIVLSSTDFSSDTIGQPPDGFTGHEVNGAGTLDMEVESDGGGGQQVRVTDSSGLWVNGLLMWDTPEDTTDGELLVQFSVTTDAEDSDLAAFGLAARVTLDGGTPDEWIMAIADFANDEQEIRHRDTLDGNVQGQSLSSKDAQTFTADGTKYWVRFNFSERTYRMRSWVDGATEPSVWGIEFTATSETEVQTSGGFAFVVDRLESASGDNDQLLIHQIALSDDPDTSAEVGASITDTVSEPVHGMFGWRDNSNVPWLAMGTPTKAYIYSEGLLNDVTPAGFTEGSTDASSQIAGYGSGAYGAGDYNVGVASSVGTLLEAQSWHFDNFGELLVAVAHSDGVLYKYAPNADTDLVAITGDSGLPTDNTGVVVTPERFVMALGAGGDPRLIQWADQESLSVWNPTSENSAGDFSLSSAGAILAGARGRGETLIWTTEDLWTMQFIGGTLIFSAQQAGANCGMIGRRAYAMVRGGVAFWMGANAFFVYDGAVRPLTSDVSDYVFTDLNRTQRSKIFTMVWPEFNEVWWFYPTENSTDIDRYVCYNYQEDHWAIGELSRTAGVPRGVFDFPMMADKTGILYDHERGTTYLDEDQETALVPFAESGPWVIAQGDNTMMVREIIPDENTLGDVQAQLLTRLYPTATEISSGPFSLSNPTSVRVSGRQVALRVEQAEPNWRVGVIRLDVVPQGRR